MKPLYCETAIVIIQNQEHTFQQITWRNTNHFFQQLRNGTNWASQGTVDKSNGKRKLEYSASFLPVDAQGDDETKSVGQSKVEIMKLSYELLFIKSGLQKAFPLQSLQKDHVGIGMTFTGCPAARESSTLVE